MSDIHSYNFPATIKFGAGAVRLLPAFLRERGLLRPLLVTDKGLAGLPVFGGIVAMLSDAGLQPTVFAEIWGNPVESMVNAGAEALRAADADAVVCIGGGAALDVGKVIALMAHHPGGVFDYEDEKPDALPVDGEMPVIVTIPTTAGTGSEVGRAAVIAEDNSHVKRIIFHARLLADLVLIDPELTIDLPASVTAATGIDALTHLVEAYIAKGYHPMCDGIALEGIRLVEHSLRAAYRCAKDRVGPTPEHLKARGDMMNAAMMGAVAFQKGLGVNHSCAHALSTIVDMHHGLANGVVFPYCMDFNRDAVGDRFHIISHTIGLANPGPDAFVQWLHQLKADLGIPATLIDAKVDREHLNALVEVAVGDPCHLNNPKPVDRADFVALFEAAYGT